MFGVGGRLRQGSYCLGLFLKVVPLHLKNLLCVPVVNALPNQIGWRYPAAVRGRWELTEKGKGFYKEVRDLSAVIYHV